MTIASGITKLKENLTASYTACEDKGATMPAQKNFDSLPATIESISAGGEPVTAVNASSSAMTEGEKVWLQKESGGTSESYDVGGVAHAFSVSSADSPAHGYLHGAGNSNTYKVSEDISYLSSIAPASTSEIIYYKNHVGYEDNNGAVFFYSYTGNDEMYTAWGARNYKASVSGNFNIPFFNSGDEMLTGTDGTGSTSGNIYTVALNGEIGSTYTYSGTNHVSINGYGNQCIRIDTTIYPMADGVPIAKLNPTDKTWEVSGTFSFENRVATLSRVIGNFTIAQDTSTKSYFLGENGGLIIACYNPVDLSWTELNADDELVPEVIKPYYYGNFSGYVKYNLSGNILAVLDYTNKEIKFLDLYNDVDTGYSISDDLSNIYYTPVMFCEDVYHIVVAFNSDNNAATYTYYYLSADGTYKAYKPSDAASLSGVSNSGSCSDESVASGASGNFTQSEITGTYLTVTPSTSAQSILPSTYDSDCFTGVSVDAVTSSVDANITADNIKSGVSILGVTGSYEGTVINNQDKTVTENGTVTADSGYTGLGTVTVNVAGGSDTFETQLVLDNIVTSETQQTEAEIRAETETILSAI